MDLGSVLPIDDLVVAGDAIISEHARHFVPPKVAEYEGLHHLAS
ncbi:hypothetical protein ACHMXB_13625 [Arthrobacter sp. UC242_113]